MRANMFNHFFASVGLCEREKLTVRGNLGGIRRRRNRAAAVAALYR